MPRLLSVSIADELAERTDALARASGKTRSEVVRDALREHLLREQLLSVRGYGALRAERLGVGPEDVEGLVDEVRSGPR